MRLWQQAAIAGLLVTVACGGGDGGPTNPNNNTQTGTVQGTVQDQTGAAVSGASVALRATGQTTRNTTTNAAGSYTFSSVTGFFCCAEATAGMTRRSNARNPGNLMI